MRDNLRPIVPAWDKNNRVLLWWRGSYTAAQNFDTAVVGIIDRPAETLSPMTYVDATSANTSFNDGLPLTTTGPGTKAGAADNQWHERAGIGNGDTVLTSAETGGEDAPTLRTTLTLPRGGVYDVWVNFWGRPGADWRIKVGLSSGQMQLFREMACKEVEAGDYTSSLVLTNVAENAYLYQAYLGRVTITANTAVSVYVDDAAVAAGTTGPLVGDTVRTWYDGVSYATVEVGYAPLRITQTSYQASDPGNGGNPSFTLRWRSVPDATYTVLRKVQLDEPAWTLLTNGLPSGGSLTSYTDNTVQ